MIKMPVFRPYNERVFYHYSNLIDDATSVKQVRRLVAEASRKLGEHDMKAIEYAAMLSEAFL